jgi:anhydro-N-acetylmuramic acid kinase
MKVVGLMSGTSLDGIDAVLMEIGGASEPSWALLAFFTRPYQPGERALIQDCLASGRAKELALLHGHLGEWFASAVLEVLDKAGVSAGDVAAVGSHGQTVWHEPPEPGHPGVSLQLGCPAIVAERTGLGVVSDFRSRDLAAGGHGAPLVPWADRILFSHPDGPRALQNLGGMANVTWLPRASEGGSLVGFDTGPGVALVDAAVEMATAGRMTYDQDGELARKGQVREDVLDRLMAHPFFHRPPPKSTGREVFGPGMLRELVETLKEQEGGFREGDLDGGWLDLLATLTALTARSVGQAYRQWVLPRGVDQVFLTGGGARNPALVKAIEKELSPVPVLDGSGLGMDPDAREAAAFAVLAWAHLNGIPANEPAVTGAEGPRVLGSWTPGRGEGRP